jgi:hypothetical protein
MAITDYSTDPDLNVQISGINIAEGCPPSGINNAIRQLMADVKVEKDTRDAEQAAKDAEQDAAIAGKLDKSGGTMTGPLYLQYVMRGVKNSGLGFYGGDAWRTGAYIELQGPQSNYPNVLSMCGADGSLLQGLSDGWKIGDSSILTSAGGRVGELTAKSLASSFDAADVTTTPDSALYGRAIRFVDKNGATFGMLQPAQWSNGGNALRLIVAKKDGSEGCVLTIEQKKDGTSGFTWNGSPVLTLVASWRSGTEWYRKYSDGWIEQGGIGAKISDGNTNVTFPTHFSNTNYTITTGALSSTIKAHSSIKNKSTTGCTIGSWVKDDYESFANMWYACGY